MAITVFPLIATTLMGALWFSDCDTCKPNKVCKPHKDADAAAIKEIKPLLKSDAVADRQQALKELALLNLEHENAPSKPVTELIADALEDDSYEVRGAALRLLGMGQDPEVVVKATINSLKETRKELSKLGRGPRGGGGRGGGQDGGEPRELTEEEQQKRELREKLTAYSGSLVEAMGKLPDDRVVKELSDVFGQLAGGRWTGRMATPVARALVDLESREALKGVVQHASIAVDASARESDDGNQGGGGRGRGGGGRGGDNNAGRDLHEMLLALAKKKDLEGMPQWGKENRLSWKDWFARNVKHFPAKLGKLDVDKMREARG